MFDATELAVDLAYEKHPSEVAHVRAASRETTLYWIPRLTPVFLVSDGVAIYARKHRNGHTIVVDHGNDWLTVYGGLEHMFVIPTDRKPRREEKLHSGDILGCIGAAMPTPLRTLHFELWRLNRLQDYDQVDPIRHMRRWRAIAWEDSSLEREFARHA